MKLVTTLAAAAAVCLMLIPEDASAQRRAGFRAAGVGVRTVGIRAPVYRTAFRGAGFRTAAVVNRGWGYRSNYRYQPYWGWGAVAAVATTAAYRTAAWDPYYAYAGYDNYDYPVSYRYSSYGYSSCGPTLAWVSTRWGVRQAWVSRCWW
jgi:hypothetical protein